MEQIHIIQGFSEIKTELIEKCKLTKTESELRLWFSFDANLLCAHDYNEHKKNIVIAMYSPFEKNWIVYLKNRPYGRKVVEYAIATSSVLTVKDMMSALYDLHGFLPMS